MSECGVPCPGDMDGVLRCWRPAGHDGPHEVLRPDESVWLLWNDPQPPPPEILEGDVNAVLDRLLAVDGGPWGPGAYNRDLLRRFGREVVFELGKWAPIGTSTPGSAASRVVQVCEVSGGWLWRVVWEESQEAVPLGNGWAAKRDEAIRAALDARARAAAAALRWETVGGPS